MIMQALDSLKTLNLESDPDEVLMLVAPFFKNTAYSYLEDDKNEEAVAGFVRRSPVGTY
jgi:hypothetical protein